MAQWALFLPQFNFFCSTGWSGLLDCVAANNLVPDCQLEGQAAGKEEDKPFHFSYSRDICISHCYIFTHTS
uniref:Secreted protein n=1 Tax=Oryza brachyantha TaxID=4533 RepID=J3N1C4_ORYBR